MDIMKCLAEKVKFEIRPEGGEGVRHLDIWGKHSRLKEQEQMLWGRNMSQEQSGAQYD